MAMSGRDHISGAGTHHNEMLCSAEVEERPRAYVGVLCKGVSIQLLDSRVSEVGQLYSLLAHVLDSIPLTHYIE